MRRGILPGMVLVMGLLTTSVAVAGLSGYNYPVERSGSTSHLDSVTDHSGFFGHLELPPLPLQGTIASDIGTWNGTDRVLASNGGQVSLRFDIMDDEPWASLEPGAGYLNPPGSKGSSILSLGEGDRRWNPLNEEHRAVQPWRFDDAGVGVPPMESIPEPATLILVGLGLVGVAARKKLKRS